MVHIITIGIIIIFFYPISIAGHLEPGALLPLLLLPTVQALRALIFHTIARTHSTLSSDHLRIHLNGTILPR